METAWMEFLFIIFPPMSDQSYEEIAQERNSLRDEVDRLKRRNASLESDLDDAKDDLRRKENEIDDLEGDIDDLNQEKGDFKWKFTEIMENYLYIWRDETKDQQLITRMKEIYAEFK